MSNINDNTLGNQENQELQGNPQDDHTPVPSPQSSPRRSREGTPEGSHANGNTQFENDEVVNESLQKLIAQQVNKALEAFVSQLPVAPTTPTPNDNTLENPRSGLANSGSGVIPTESRDGEPDSFIKAHSGAQKVKKRMEDIFKIKQGDSELLREFVNRFQHERMMLPRVLDNWVAIAFTSNLNEKSSEAMRQLKESLREFPATTWNDVYNKYSVKLRIEEDIISRSQKEEKVSSRRAETEKRSGKNRLLQCEVDHLLKQGYLTELFSERGKQAYMKNRQEPPKPPSPKRTVNVISGGEDINGVTYTAANKVSKVTIIHRKQVRHVLDEESSSVNIILLRVLRDMQAEDKLIPKAHTLSGFDNSSVVTKGEVILTTFAEGVVKDTKFQVVDIDMAYNMILGRPWIHEMDVVPSTLHQVIKFPSPWGICQIPGDQHTSRSINSVVDSSTGNEEK
ncbi:uncharacterized protein [Nicotiana sylvestris]|uniref:uncharacterized protein n=1 Tax=Nicotiana sylvestris TaxID=4096 RepID=UPI00388CDF3C